MRFLIDHQLPPALAEFFRRYGHTANHVRELRLKSEMDIAIWEYALKNDLIVVSKDRDFFDFACRPGDEGKLVWVRLGNCRTAPLLTTFEKFLPQIVNSFADGNRIIELR